MQIVYLSIVGNTRRFVERLGMPAIELSDITVYTTMDQPYIIIAPTYEIEATDIINDFLEHEDNLDFCRGVVGAGNRNFNDLYCFTAEDLSMDYDIPLLHRFEIQGSDYDLQRVKEIVAEIENTNYV